MRASRSLLAAAAVGAVLASAPTVAPHAAAAKPRKPSVKVTGLSPNRWFVRPGGTVRANDGTNGCYVIAGPAGAPPSLTVYAFVRTVGVPASAPTTVTITTPWDGALPPGSPTVKGKLSDVLFRSRGRPQAGIFGGPQGANDRHRYVMLPTGLPTSAYYSGRYAIKVVTRVAGRTLTARGAITVAC